MEQTNAHLATASAADVCRTVGISERSLRRAFPAATGMTWRQYLLESRILRAMALLAEPGPDHSGRRQHGGVRGELVLPRLRPTHRRDALGLPSTCDERWQARVVTNDERIAELGRQGAALAEMAAGSGLDLAVPTCPGWSIAEVVRHVGGGHRWCIRRRHRGRGSHRLARWASQRSRKRIWRPGSTMGCRSSSSSCARHLPTRPPGPRCRRGSAEWWTRKMVVETAIHRWDAEAARERREDRRSPEPGGHRRDRRVRL